MQLTKKQEVALMYQWQLVEARLRQADIDISFEKLRNDKHK